MSVELGNRVYRVWQSDAMQKVYKARHQYWHLSAIDYYMEHITRFCKTDFVPSPEDTLVARIRTTGIAHIKLEENLKGHGKEADKASEHTERARNSTRDREKDRNEVNNSNTTKTTRPQNPMNKHIDVRSDHYHHHEHRPKEVLFDIVDVGGQRNEREKWAYEADKTRAILFVVNLAGYNQVMFEDQKKNRLEEAIHLYHDIHNHPLFALHGDNNNRTKAYPSRIYLVLNKKDLFQEMIKHTPLHQVPAFQDCTDTDSDGCIAYILSRFNDQSTLPASSKPVQPFVISALDEREVGTMWQHIKTDIVESNQPWIEKQAQGAVRAIKQASASAGKRKDNMDREKNGTRRIMVSSALGVGANARERRQ